MRFSFPGKTATTNPGRPRLISLKLREMSQLFNSMDPSPFIEKDLDDDAEEFIVSWDQFFPDAPLKLRIYLDQWPAEDPKELIRTAVHNHFAHRAQITNLEFKRLLKQGRTSLFVGLVLVRLSASQQNIVGPRRGHLGCRRAGEPHDCRMGCYVATDADLSLRLVALAPSEPNFVKLSHMPVEVVQHGKG